MKPAEHYIQLRSAYFPQEINQHVSLTLDTLAETLCCTKKNVKRILHKLEEAGWLHYTPGIGRGNKSSIHYTKEFSQDLSTFMDSFIREEKIDEALQLLKLPLPKELLEPLSQTLTEQFGFQQTDEQLDILRIPLKRKLSLLDPAHVYIATENHILRQVFDTLVFFDEKTKNIHPHLAHQWEYDETTFSWTFYLRKGIVFHHGKTLTAKDVVYSFTRVRELQGPYSWMVEGIMEIHSPHPSVVTVKLKHDNKLFLQYVSTICFAVLPSDIPFHSEHLIGTGPFQFSLTNEQLSLSAYNHYFKERALIDRIDIWFVSPETKLEFSYELPSYLRNESVDKKEVTMTEIGCRYLGFNFNKEGILHDSHFRRAIYEVLDSKKMIAEFQRENSIPSYSFLPKVSEQKHVSKSLEKAREELRKSSYNGETLQLYALDFTQSIEDAHWFQEHCKKIGILVSLQFFSIQEYYDERISREADMILMGEIFDENVYLSFLNAFFNTHSFLYKFISGHYREELELRLHELKRANNDGERDTHMQRIEDFLIEKNLLIFNYHPIKTHSYSPLLAGVSLSHYGWSDFRKLWIKHK